MTDPSRNVNALIAAAADRQDDLRTVEARHVRELATCQETISAINAAHSREVADLRAYYDAELRHAESARIDAIRAVDQGTVIRAAEVSATQASILAAQVATSAETLRTQVAAAATAAAVALGAALDPIQKDIADLRRAQYEAQGVKAQTGETRLNIGAILGGISLMLVILFGTIGVLISLSHP